MQKTNTYHQKAPGSALKDCLPIQSPPTGYVDPRKIFNTQVQIYQADRCIVLKDQKKTKRKQQFDPKKYKIISVSYPISLAQDQKSKRKYKIQIKYTKRDTVSTLKKYTRVKTILFGVKGVPDYVDDKNQKKRLSRVNIIQKVQDPFSPNHYRLLLLNRCPTIQQAYMKYVQDLGL